VRARNNGSKVSASLTAGLVFFVAIIAFVVGVLSGQSFSDRNHAVNFIDEKIPDSVETTSEPGLGENLTDKEVDALTEKALKDARQSSTQPSKDEVDEFIANLEAMESKEVKNSSSDSKGLQPEKMSNQRSIASVAPTLPTTAKAKNVEYTIQVAAYKTLKEAESHSEKLKQNGLPAFALQASVKGATWYKVNIGSFEDLRSAKRYDRRLKKEGSISASFIRKVERQ